MFVHDNLARTTSWDCGACAFITFETGRYQNETVSPC